MRSHSMGYFFVNTAHKFACLHNLIVCRYSNLLITELVIRENGVGARRQAVILILCAGTPQAKPRG